MKGKGDGDWQSTGSEEAELDRYKVHVKGLISKRRKDNSCTRIERGKEGHGYRKNCRYEGKMLRKFMLRALFSLESRWKEIKERLWNVGKQRVKMRTVIWGKYTLTRKHKVSWQCRKSTCLRLWICTSQNYTVGSFSLANTPLQFGRDRANVRSLIGK